MSERTYTEAEVVRVIEAVIRHKARRAIAADAQGRTKEADLWHSEADGARYVLWEFIGFNKALDAKHRIYAEEKAAQEAGQ